MIINQSSGSKSQKSAFSLVEVAIAMAIFSGSLILILGMLPQALEDMRKASSNSMKRRIAQNIVGELMLSDWQNLHQFNSDSEKRRHYDSQGIPTKGFTIDTVFTARLKVLPRDVNIDQNHSLESLKDSLDSSKHDLPDDKDISLSTNQHARRVIVEVTDIPDPEFDFESSEYAQSILKVGTVVANFNEI